MSSIADRPMSLVESYEQQKPILNTIGPEAWQTLRERAIREFAEFGVPTTKDEEFKYVSMRALTEGQFGPAYGATVDRHQLHQTTTGGLDAITIAFINGQFAPELSTDHALPGGVFAGTLADGLLSHAEVVEKHLGKVATLKGKLGTSNDERFVQLNTAFLGEGAFIYVPRGVAVELPIHIVYVNKADHGPFAAHPRSLVVLEENAQAKVVESYLGLDGTYFVNAVTEIVLGAHANLEHTKAQFETDSSVHIATIAADQEAGSVLAGCNVNFGGQLVRNDVNVWLNGEHTETWLNGVAVGLEEQAIDNHTRIDHAKPNCNSFEIYKSILGDKALGVFNGKIFVYEDAQKTDAKQTNQAILLSPTATINTKPQLEIFADDVKCTHGATVGNLSEEALFYLRARGIPKNEARSLLVYAFAAEVLEKLTIDDLKDKLEGALFEKLGGFSENPSEA